MQQDDPSPPLLRRGVPRRAPALPPAEPDSRSCFADKPSPGTPMVTIGRSSPSTSGRPARMPSFAEWAQEQVGAEELLYLTEQLKPGDLDRVILPFGRFRRCWDAFVLLLAVYTAVEVPILVGYSPNVPDAVGYIDLVLDILFIADVVLNFCTAVVVDARQPRRLVYAPREIARAYLRGWFALDLVSSLPWEVVARAVHDVGTDDGLDADGETLRTLEVLRLPKMLRLGRVAKLLQRVDGAPSIGWIVLSFVGAVFLAHVLGCTWCVVAASSDGWMDANGRSDGIHQYGVNFYVALMALMGDDIAPVTRGEIAYASVATLLGVCMNAIIFASVVAYVLHSGAQWAEHAQKTAAVSRAMRLLGIDGAAARRIRAHHTYCWARHRNFEGHRLLGSTSLLPACVRMAARLRVHEQALRAFPLFTRLDDQASLPSAPATIRVGGRCSRSARRPRRCSRRWRRRSRRRYSYPESTSLSPAPSRVQSTLYTRVA